MRAIFLFLLIGISGISLQAQKLFISTDYENCGMGLKDSAGNWVLPPVYTHIHTSMNFFIISQGNAYGLANRYGQVIVPPQYDRIHAAVNIRNTNYCENPYASVPKYDKSDFAYYFVEQKNKIGLIDTTGKILIPIEYRYISDHNDGSFLANKSNHEWTVFHADGSSVRMRYHKKWAPNYLGCGLYEYSRVAAKSFTHPFFRTAGYPFRKMGLMNESGKRLTKAEYAGFSNICQPGDLIETCNGTEMFFLDLSGKTVFRLDIANDPRFFIYTKSYYSAMNRKGYYVGSKNKSWGILQHNGDTLLPFVFRKISRLYIPSSVSQTEWLHVLTADSLSGVFDPQKKKWLFKPEYQYISCIRMYPDHSDSGTYCLFLLKKNNRFGLISNTGDTIIPFTAEGYSVRNENYLFRVGSDLYRLYFPNYQFGKDLLEYRSGISIVKKTNADGRFEKRESAEGAVLYINPELKLNTIYYRNYSCDNTYDSLVQIAAFIFEKLEPAETLSPDVRLYSFPLFNFRNDGEISMQYVLLQSGKNTGKNFIQPVEKRLTDSRYSYYVSYSSIMRSDGKELFRIKPDGSAEINAGTTEHNEFYAIIGNFHQSKLMDGDGRWINETPFGNLAYCGSDYFSFMTKSKAKKPKKDPDYFYHYTLLDFHSGQLVIGPGYQSAVQPQCGYHSAIIVRGEAGIYSFDRKGWAAQPVFDRIIVLDSAGKYYGVKTCSGKIGIIDWEGKWLADTSWTAMINASYDKAYGPGKYVPYTHRRYEKVVLTDNGRWLIVDLEHGTSSASRNDALQIAGVSLDNVRPFSAAGYQQKLKLSEWRCTYCPSVYAAGGHTDISQWREWQLGLVFDSLFAYRTYSFDSAALEYRYSQNCYCNWSHITQYNELYKFEKEYDNNYLIHELNLRNDSCISVNCDNGNLSKRFTAMLFADGAHNMLLDSLFTGNEWKNFLVGYILHELNAHPGLEGNCSNPAAFPAMLRKNFGITENGLLLYLDQYRLNHQRFEILIPWEELKPYLREDVKRKMGMN